MTNYPLSLFRGLVPIIMAIIAYWMYRMFWKGRLPPMTRSAELNEHLLKQAVLGKHGKTPDERNVKRRWGFTWFDDDVRPEEKDR